MMSTKTSSAAEAPGVYARALDGQGNGMRPSGLRRAIAAGRATASELGLPVEDAIVIHNSDRVALRLVPCDVLARVAPSGHLADSDFEVEVAHRLTGVDAPVAELDPRGGLRVYVRDTFAVSLWSYYKPVKSKIAPADYADVLMRHHSALRRTDLEAPHFTTRVAAALREVNDREQSPELPDADREFPRADHDLIQRCRALSWALFSAWRWRRDDHMPDRGHWRAEGLTRVRTALDRCAPG